MNEVNNDYNNLLQYLMNNFHLFGNNSNDDSKTVAQTALEDNKDLDADEEEDMKKDHYLLAGWSDEDENAYNLRNELMEISKQENSILNIVRKNNLEQIICLNIDGFQGSENVIKIISKEFMEKHWSLISTYISDDEEHDKENKWKLQKKTVTEKYDYLFSHDYSGIDNTFLCQMRDYNLIHPVEQLKRVSVLNGASYLFINFDGLYTTTFKKDSQETGIDRLLMENVMPTLVIKENNLRGVKNKGYKWLLFIDDDVENSLKTLKKFYDLIDVNIDNIYAIKLFSGDGSHTPIKEKFFDTLTLLGFPSSRAQFYYYTNIDNKLDFLKQFVTKNDRHYFDFFIFYNDPHKYLKEGKNSDFFKMFFIIRANLAFSSNYSEDVFNQYYEDYKKTILKEEYTKVINKYKKD